MLKMLTKPRRRQIRVGPQGHRSEMSLADIGQAVARAGHRYELGKGIVEVSDIPHPSHLALVERVRNQLILHRMRNSGSIQTISAAGESKVMIESSQVERHPDISVYLSSPPDIKDVWSIWVPTLVVEVISKDSAVRDYNEKPAEYLAFGVREYWIVDGFKRIMTAYSRWRGEWKTRIVKPPQKYKSVFLPGFTLDLKRVFAAGK